MIGEEATECPDVGRRRRRDVNALNAICLCAKFVFQGARTLYGVTSGVLGGTSKALAIFHRDIDINIAQIGVSKIADLGPQFLMRKEKCGRMILRCSPASLG
ncbi:alpha-hydroxy-acid oxidizing protein [Bradyrhizobium tunisiense]|uniref:alpha-hydroxy-acid oxidizing protein n=1 Tax=Bradyrhizobium tunisiense TaxID=3278709 RepID=UPI0035E34AAF